jgi:hypothetical protein
MKELFQAPFDSAGGRLSDSTQRLQTCSPKKGRQSSGFRASSASAAAEALQCDTTAATEFRGSESNGRCGIASGIFTRIVVGSTAGRDERYASAAHARPCECSGGVGKRRSRGADIKRETEGG